MTSATIAAGARSATHQGLAESRSTNLLALPRTTCLGQLDKCHRPDSGEKQAGELNAHYVALKQELAVSGQKVQDWPERRASKVQKQAQYPQPDDDPSPFVFPKSHQADDETNPHKNRYDGKATVVVRSAP